MKTLRLSLIFCTLVTAVLSAAAAWDEKPFLQWSDKDIDKLLTDSPWAGKATLTHEREGANLPPIDLRLNVIIRSAEPIRRAVARQQLAAGLPAAPDLEANLAKPYPRYAFAIPKIPQMYRMGLTKTAQSAVLKVKGQELMAVDAAVQLLDKNGKEVAPPPARGPAPAPQASSGVQIIPGTGHTAGGTGCGQRLMREFIEKGSPAALDTSCIDKVKRPAFFLSPAGPDPNRTGGPPSPSASARRVAK